MKKLNIYSGLISKTKNNNKNNKINTVSSQTNNINKSQSKIKNDSFRQILLKFKTQKSSLQKTPPKSLNKISGVKHLKNSKKQYYLKKDDMSEPKIIGRKNKQYNIIYKYKKQQNINKL